MLATVLSIFEGLLTAGKAMASFDSFRKGRKGDSRALIEEMKENSRLCFRVVADGISPAEVVPRFMTTEFDRLNKAGFNFNSLKAKTIPAFPGIEGTTLATWPNKETGALIQNIYDKIKTLKSINDFKPEYVGTKRRIVNIHQRLLLLLLHAEA